MRGRPTVKPRDRGMSTVVSHVMSVGITTLLIIGLVATASGFLEEQRTRAAEEELETIGQRLATSLEAADRLGRQGDDVRVRATLPDAVAGSTYTVRLLHDSAAGSGDCGAFPTTSTCLRLATTQYDQTALVPVYNETDLSLDAGPGGQFTIASAGGGDTVQLSRRSLEMSPRVGIGQSVGSGPQFAGGAALSQTPIPQFTFSPGIPSTGDTIQFDAGGSTDADGHIDEYAWDFDDDGSFEVAGSSRVSPSKWYGNAGSYNVTLRVTDNSGLGASITREIDVSGLEYEPNSLSTTDATGEDVRFEVRSMYPSGTTVTIERILIDPADDDLDELSEDQPGGYDEDEYEPHEIEIETPTDNGFVDWNGNIYNTKLKIPEGGSIVDIDNPSIEWYEEAKDGGNVELESGYIATIWLNGFPESVDGDTLTIGVRYEVNGTVGSTVFTKTVS